MGCGGSKDVEAQPELEEAVAAGPQAESSEVKDVILVVEALQIDETKPTETTFIASVLKARQNHAEKPGIMRDCCNRLQVHDRKPGP